MSSPSRAAYYQRRRGGLRRAVNEPRAAVMHNTAQTAMIRSVEPGQGNETALQNRPRTS
jgi:hypothetical protein